MLQGLYRMLKSGSRSCATGFCLEAKSGQMFDQGGSVHIFGQHIRRVMLAGDLGQGELASAKAILHPLVCCGKVAHLAQSPPAANPHGSAGV